MDYINHVKYNSMEICFDEFCSADSLENILSKFNCLCDVLNLSVLPGNSSFYANIRRKLSHYWKAEALFSNVDLRVRDPRYESQNACRHINALVIGCGPCGLRCAIELALLGAKVVVVEKRTSFSRNNIIHLWPYLIHDLKSLGAKSFFGKFCSGSIDHISIRTLQCILLKVSLLLGILVIPGETFVRLVEPTDDSHSNVDLINGCGDYATEDDENSKMVTNNRPLRALFSLFTGKIASHGWSAEFEPQNYALSCFEFDVFVGASGKSYSCLNFPRKQLRCRLAIAITANFANHGSVEEARLEEISGVVSIFNQQYFADISRSLGVELENLVYYKDETHYFVMTVRKKSLLTKGVLLKDFEDPIKLLHQDNINQLALQRFSLDVAKFVTGGVLAQLDFALNEQASPDVAVFDFTNLSAAEYASRIIDRRGRPLCQCLVGDALIEPFWPTGSGCALGFLSALDAAWAISLFAAGHHPLKVIAWRDSIFQRLSQTSPSNMPQNFASYSLSPNTRYSFCDLELVQPMQVRHLYDNDVTVDMPERAAFVYLRESVKDSEDPPASAVFPDSIMNAPVGQIEIIQWFQYRLSIYKLFSFCSSVPDFQSTYWACGRALLCLVHKYRPDILDEVTLYRSVSSAISEIGDINKNFTDAKRLEEAVGLIFVHFSNIQNGRKQENLENQVDDETSLNINSICKSLNSPLLWSHYLVSLFHQLHNLSPDQSLQDLTPPKTKLNVILRPKVSSFDVLSSPRNSCKHSHRSAFSSQLSSFSQVTDLLMNPPDVQIAFKHEHPQFVVQKGLMAKRRSELITMLHDPASAKRHSAVLCSKPSSTHDDWCRTDQRYAILSDGFDHSKAKFSAIRDSLPASEGTHNSNSPIVVSRVQEVCVVCKSICYAADSQRFGGYRLHLRCFLCAKCKCALRPETAHYLRGDLASKDPEFYCPVHFQLRSSETFEIRKVDVSSCLRESKKPSSIEHSLFYNLLPFSPPDSIAMKSSNFKRRESSGRSIARNVKQNSEIVSQALSSVAVNEPSYPAESHRFIAKGIRDELTPPIDYAVGTVGIPEHERRILLENKFNISHNSLLFEVVSSPNSLDLHQSLDTGYEADHDDDPLRPLTLLDDISDISLYFSHSPAQSIEQAIALCHFLRQKKLYLLKNPTKVSNTASCSSTSSNNVDKLGAKGCKLLYAPSHPDDSVSVDSFRSVPSEKIKKSCHLNTSTTDLGRNALLNPPSSKECTISVTSHAPSLMAAKLRFCMEAPKPVSIDPITFISSKNKDYTSISSLFDITEHSDILDFITQVCPNISTYQFSDQTYEYSISNFEYVPIIRDYLHDVMTTSSFFEQTAFESTHKISEITFHEALCIECVDACTFTVELTPLSIHISEICTSKYIPTASTLIDYEDNEDTNLIESCTSFFESSIPTRIPQNEIPSLSSSCLDSGFTSIIPALFSTEPEESIAEIQREYTTEMIMNENNKNSNIDSHLESESHIENLSSSRSTDKTNEKEYGNANVSKSRKSVVRRKLPFFMLTSRLDSDSDNDAKSPSTVYGTTESSESSQSISCSESDSLHSDSNLVVIDSLAQDAKSPIIGDGLLKLDSHLTSKEFTEKIQLVKLKLVKLDEEMKSLEDRGLSTEEQLRRCEANLRSNDCLSGDIYFCSSEPDIATACRDPIIEHRKKVGKVSIWRHKLCKRQSASPAFQSIDQEHITDVQELPAVKTNVNIDLRAQRSHLFGELLSLTSQRNSLLNVEAQLNHELKQLELDQYQKALECTYNSLQSSPSCSCHTPIKSPSNVEKPCLISSRSPLHDLHKISKKKSPLLQFRKSSASHDKKRSASVGTRKWKAISPLDVRDPEPVEKDLLLNEIWRVINKRKTLFAIQSEIVHCATLQESSILNALHGENFPNAILAKHDFIQTKSQ